MKNKNSYENRKEYHAAYYKKYRKTDEYKEKKNKTQREYRKKPENSKRVKANRMLSNAIRDEKLIPQPCVKCGDPKSEGHHEDYSNPLEVIWLCKTHHLELHKLKKMKQQPETKHTAGKWKLNGLPNPTKPEYYCLYVKEGGPETIEHVAQITATGLNDKSRVHENAKLIASAPQLKEENNLLKSARSESMHHIANLNGEITELKEANRELLEALRRIDIITARFSIETMTMINTIASEAIRKHSKQTT